MFGYAIIAGLLCWLISTACPMWLRWAFHFGAPLCAGLVWGLIFGELEYGLKVGATIQSAYIGLLAIGGSLPSEMSLAGYLGVCMTMIAHLDPSTGLAVATPIGLLGALAQGAKMALNAVWVHKGDEYAAAGNTRGVAIMNCVGALVFPFFLWFIPAFLCVYLGGTYFESFMASIPTQFTAVFSLIGKAMPALGLAMLLQLLNKTTTIPFLIIGFVLAAYLGLDVTSITLIGIGFAILHYFYIGKESE